MKRKICMLGASAVGKTSLVARFVHQTFDERYLTSIGVKVDRKDVVSAQGECRMLLWDLNGEDDFQRVRQSYLRGAAGCLYVVDPTRPETLDVVRSLRELVHETLGPTPGVLVLNKADLREQWLLDPDTLGEAALETSARSGDGVERAFETLARDLLGEPKR